MSIIKTLQVGRVTFNSTQDVADVDLPSAVDTSRVMLTLKCRLLNTGSLDMVAYGSYGVTPRMLDGDTLRLERWYVPGYSIQIIVDYFVYELIEGVEVDSGQVQKSSNPTDVSLSITDETDCISICHLLSEYTGWSGDFDDQAFYHVVFNPGTGPELRIRSNISLSSPSHLIYWQVIRLPVANVERLVINNIPNTSNQNDYDLSSAVDLDNSFLLWSCQHSDGTIGDPNNEHLKSSRMLDNDTIRTYAYTAMAAPYACAYVVELPQGVIKRKDEGFVYWTGETYNLDYTNEKPGDVIFNLTGCFNHWSGANSIGDNYKDIGITVVKIDDDTSQLQRGDQDVSGVQAYTAYQHIEFAVGSEDMKFSPRGFALGMFRGF